MTRQSVINGDTPRASTVAFSGMQVRKKEPEKIPEIMLDSGSTITLGKDRSLFFKVWDLKDKVMMDTNGGSKFLSKGGEWKGYGTAYYVPDAMMNIVSLSDAIEK